MYSMMFIRNFTQIVLRVSLIIFAKFTTALETAKLSETAKKLKISNILTILKYL